MVLWHKNTHNYPNTNFPTFSYAFLNRYPNPFASHILSIDVLNTEFVNNTRSNFDNNSDFNSVQSKTGCRDNNILKITRIIKKSGKLPQWIKPFLGKINQSMIMEVLYVNKDNQTLQSYTKNLDHTKIIQVEEFTTYQYNTSSNSMDVSSKVKFTSGFNAYKATTPVANAPSIPTNKELITKSGQESKTELENISNINTNTTSPKRFSFLNLDLSSRIEQWSHTKFAENIKKTRNGMDYVLENITLNNETPK